MNTAVIIAQTTAETRQANSVADASQKPIIHIGTLPATNKDYGSKASGTKVSELARMEGNSTPYNFLDSAGSIRWP